jgi:hypothetical protein
MLCQGCQEAESREQLAVEDPGDDAGELCSRCGHLRGPEDMVKRAQDKYSQLARFGLAGTRRSLLDRRHRGDH